MDDQSLDFHLKVHEAYHALAAREPGRVKVVDGRAGIEAIERQVWALVEPRLKI
jgi:thymidylate kinase